jgi:hypothetical protein
VAATSTSIDQPAVIEKIPTFLGPWPAGCIAHHRRKDA